MEYHPSAISSDMLVNKGGGDRLWSNSETLSSIVIMLFLFKMALFFKTCPSWTTTLSLQSISVEIAPGFDEEPPPAPVSEALYQKLLHEGIGAAVEDYRKLKEITKTPDIPSESEINSAAFYYLESNRIEEAITICRFNLALHPNYANAYARLAEVYSKRGDIQHAIKNYKKALEIDPNMSMATQALKKLVNEN